MKFRCLINVLSIKHQFHRHSSSSSNGKYIFINGCDTIFTHTLATQLDKQGFNTFIGVYDLKSKFLLKTQLSKRSTIFPIDITRLDDINNAYELITKQTHSLYALVNNIDISTINRLERTSMKLMEKKMNDYFFGHVSITKRFLPLLISQQNANIINLCLLNDIVDFPLESTYSSMKNALKVFSDSLRYDMILSNIRVSMIETNNSIHTSSMKEEDDENGNQFRNNLAKKVHKQWDEDLLKVQIKQLIENDFDHKVPTNTTSSFSNQINWQSKFNFLSKPIASTWLNSYILHIKSISRLFSTGEKSK